MPHKTTVPPSRLEVVARVAEYLAFGTSGLWLAFFPPEAIRQSAWVIVIYLLAAFLLAGFPAAVSAAKGKFRNEYGALWFIMTTIFVTALSLWITAVVQQKPTVVFFALVMTALCFKLLSRAGTVGRLVKGQLKEDDN